MSLIIDCLLLLSLIALINRVNSLEFKYLGRDIDESGPQIRFNEAVLKRGRHQDGFNQNILETCNSQTELLRGLHERLIAIETKEASEG